MVKHTTHKHGEQNKKARDVISMALGSLNKIPTMVDEKQYCPEVIQQLDSVVGLLKSARVELLRGHLDSCLTERMKNDKDGAVKELLKIYKMQ